MSFKKGHKLNVGMTPWNKGGRGLYAHSSESIAKIKIAKQFISAETRKKISEANKGKKRSIEAMRKMSASRTGKPTTLKQKKYWDSKKGIKPINMHGRKKIYDSDGAKGKAWRTRIKLAIHALLGEKCLHCGFTDNKALQIDHINGGGNQEVKNIVGNYQLRVLQSIIRGEKKYQLLCANCNWIKRVENNEVRKKVI